MTAFFFITFIIKSVAQCNLETFPLVVEEQ